MDYSQKLNELLLTTARQGASDLHIAVGKRPTLRIDGVLIGLQKENVLTPEDAQGLVTAMLKPEQKEKFFKYGDLDFSYSFEDKARFRVNVFFQKGFMAAALRLIQAEIKTVEELRLPPIIHEFTKLNQGFVLVVGPAGQGKSTTLAALVDEINHKRTEHIITVEDPIEYLFVQDRSIISQREVRGDSPTFHRALRSVLRQDPDVIMIGEMRERESIATSMTAAQTIDRIIDSFPSDQQNQVSSQLSATLVGIVSQRLVPRIEGGRVPATE